MTEPRSLPALLDPRQIGLHTQDYLQTFDGTFNISPILSGSGNVIGTHLEYTQLLEPQGAHVLGPMLMQPYAWFMLQASIQQGWLRLETNLVHVALRLQGCHMTSHP